MFQSLSFMQDSVVEKVVAFRFQSCPEPLVVLGGGMRFLVQVLLEVTVSLPHMCQLYDL